MIFFDDARQMLLRTWEKIEKKCPVCDHEIEVKIADLPKRFPRLECPQCHYRLDVTTRNNERLSFILGFILPSVFVVAWVLGGIIFG